MNLSPVKYCLIFLFSILLTVPVPADDDGTNEKDASKPEIKSLDDERRDVLKYGIDSEVLEVIGSIRSEKNTSFYDDLMSVLYETKNPAIMESLYFFFSDMKFGGAEQSAISYIQLLLDDQDVEDKVVSACIMYLGEIKSAEGAAVLYKVTQLDNPGFVGSALRALGKIGDDSQADILLKLLNDSDYEDKTDQNVGYIILTLGELKYQPAADILYEIADSPDAYNVNRQYACIAIGQLGDERGFSLLKDIYFTSNDSILRSYALKGLSYYQNDEVNDVLIQALKRDSYWKIRLAAAEGLGERKAENSVELLIYKVNKDPVEHIRKASIKSLGQIDTPEARQFLLDYYKDQNNPGYLRIETLKVFIENKTPGAVEIIDEVFTKEWENKTTKIVEYSAKELSTAEWPELSSVYKKMLGHPNYLVQIYGIRGIRKNNLTDLYPDAAGLDKEGSHGQVRKEAKSLSEQ